MGIHPARPRRNAPLAAAPASAPSRGARRGTEAGRSPPLQFATVHREHQRLRRRCRVPVHTRPRHTDERGGIDPEHLYRWQTDTGGSHALLHGHVDRPLGTSNSGRGDSGHHLQFLPHPTKGTTRPNRRFNFHKMAKTTGNGHTPPTGSTAKLTLTLDRNCPP